MKRVKRLRGSRFDRLGVSGGGRGRGPRGQALTETTLLAAALLIGVGSLATFAPDVLAALTLYIRGFYLVLAFPLG